MLDVFDGGWRVMGGLFSVGVCKKEVMFCFVDFCGIKLVGNS